MNTSEIPASVSQRLLWMIKHYRVDFGALNCPLVCRIGGPLDITALRQAIDDLTARHESLRTTFSGRGSRLAQHVHPPGEQPVAWSDLSGRPAPRQAADSALADELRQPIDPLQWPARTTLWRLSSTEHLLCLNLHHLVTDAWSTGILLRDLVALYDRAVTGSATLPALGWQPADFARWQHSLLSTDQLSRHQQYWRRQLQGCQTPRLAGGGPEPAGAGPSRADTVDITPATVAALRALARREKTTLFTVLLALFHARLHQITGQPDIAVASMFANRTRPELRETVGLLAGMVLLRARVADQPRFTDLVRHTHSTVIGAFAYQDLPFQLLPANVVDTGGGRADDVMFNVMSQLEHELTGGGAQFELVVPTEIGSRFPFELALAPVGEHRMRAVLFQAGGWSGNAAGRQFLDGFVELAEAVANRSDISLRALVGSP